MRKIAGKFRELISDVVQLFPHSDPAIQALNTTLNDLGQTSHKNANCDEISSGYGFINFRARRATILDRFHQVIQGQLGLMRPQTLFNPHKMTTNQEPKLDRLGEVFDKFSVVENKQKPKPSTAPQATLTA